MNSPASSGARTGADSSVRVQLTGEAPGGDGTSAWSPFGFPAFRVLWIATLVANLGTWIHDVGAAWLMTTLAPSPLMVALVQTATTLPVLLLALPAGALADILDRRRVLIFAQLWMTLAALTLGMLTLFGGTTPWTLLLLTFVLGIGTALTAPAWQAVVPELVPRPELPAAITLNSAGINVARAVGPALGGLIVAAAGPAAAFLLNAVSFLGIVGGLVWWKRAVPASAIPRERFPAAVGVGVRYVRNNPRLLAVLARTLAFILFGSALWALLPLVARQELGTGALGYGLLLGAIGVGALSGTVLLPRLRRHFPADRLVSAATLLYVVVLAATATTRSYGLALGFLFLSGVAWLTLLATFQTAAQLTVPSWVRGRALAVYLMVFFGGQAAGALFWGVVAEQVGIPTTLLLAAVGLLAGLPVALVFGLGDFEKLDLAPSGHWPAHDAMLVATEQEEAFAVSVVTEYLIDPARDLEFRMAMAQLRRVRLGSGAVSWGLWRDLERPYIYIEQFVVPSWREHLRQHQRVTASDRAVQETARSFHVGDEPVLVRHFSDAGGS